MTRKISRHGFSTVAIIIALVVITAVGFGGWQVWQNRDKKQSNNSQAMDDTSQTDRKDTEDTMSNIDFAEGGRYLVLKEWDTRIELPQELREDVDYAIFKSNSGDETLYFTSRKILAKAGADDRCALVPVSDSNGRGQHGGIIAVTRSMSEPTNEKEKLTSFRGPNGYWYTLGFSTTACYEGDTGQEQGRFKSLMETSIKHIEALEQ